ncbi:maintenance of mitochondrial morphology protein 1 [[Candida] railenensis]|uniref:Maintenance of mitochondrial morphology protein 1 n=1 Tax=[Candida] railenensis TaxID=45579 RepID=A0A9P0QV66_9ASCO|nr:maintenance of mitochondrial morphology protein 1 [[Candida] railenensis]
MSLSSSSIVEGTGILSQDQVQRLSLEQIQEQLKLHQDEFFHHLVNEQQFGQHMDLKSSSQGQNTGSSSSWSFTQGLLLGQLSVFVVIAIFIKFFVFADQTNNVTSSKSSNKTSKKPKDLSGIIVKRNKKGGKSRSYKKGLAVDGSTDNDGDDSEFGDDADDSNSFSSKISSILEKTYYDVNNHNPESLDWFNVLVAQVISQLRSEALLSDNIYHSLNDFLTTSSLPDYLDTIKLTEIDVGDDFPIFSNCRIMHSKDGTGRLEAKIDVDLSDTLTLGIETKLLLNHPMPLTAVLPVQLSVSIVRFSGCLTVSLINTNDQEFIDLQGNSNSKGSATNETPAAPNSSSPRTAVDRGVADSIDTLRNIPGTSYSSDISPSPSTPLNQITASESVNRKSSKFTTNSSDEPAGTALMFSFSPDYRLEFTVKSLIGARAKLQDVPKISSLIDSKLRSWFIERCIEPRYQVVKLPSLWPRSKNTREPVNSNNSAVSNSTTNGASNNDNPLESEIPSK